MGQWTMVRRFLTLAVAAALTACSEPTAPPPSATGLTLLLEEEPKKSVLVECPTDITETTTAVLFGGVLGEVTLGGHRITVPPEALPPGAWVVTLTAPASKYVEIEAYVFGLPASTFLQPVEVVIDYSRCSRSNIDRDPLRVWYIDSVTKEPLEDMGGVDDKVARTVTFFTNHFSGYAVAQ
jgi:hypothetical protein